MGVYRIAICPACSSPEKPKKYALDKGDKRTSCPECSGALMIDKNWWIDFYANGRRKREKIGTSRTLAEHVLAKRKVEIAENKYLDIKRERKIRFEDFADEYLESHCKPNNKGWLKADAPNIQTLKKFFAGKYLHEITPQDIERFRTERLKKVEKSTVNRILNCLSSLYNRAIEWGKATSNPAAKVKLFKVANKRTRYLEKEEVVKLLSRCCEHLKPIVIVALHTGMRKSEILGLRWHDIDIKRNVVHLLDTKNGEKREIPMNETVRAALIKVKKHRDSPFVFCGVNGKPYGSVKKSFSTACKKAGIINFWFHDLRHTLEHKQRALDILCRQMDFIWTPEAISAEASESSFDVIFLREISYSNLGQ